MHNIETPARSVFMISKEHEVLLDAVASLSSTGENCNVLIKGNTGCGKSEMVTQFAAKHERPLVVLEVGQLSESKQIFGYMDLRAGQTVYIPGLFPQAIQTPNCVVHLQEINRSETDKALNAICLSMPH
jgi:nitric oxide reductase NorQ protein